MLMEKMYQAVYLFNVNLKKNKTFVVKESNTHVYCFVVHSIVDLVVSV